jgi:hypothetical protein
MDQGRFVKVPEGVLRELARMGLTGSQWAVVAVLVAELYRWPDPRDRLSSRYLATATGLDRRTVRRALEDLVRLGVFAIGETGRGARPGRIYLRPIDAWRPAESEQAACSDKVGAPVRPVSGRTHAPTPAPPDAPLKGAPVRPQVGAPVRHKVRERETKEWNTPPPGKLTHGAHPYPPTEETLRLGIAALEAAPESEFRTVRLKKVRHQLERLERGRA